MPGVEHRDSTQDVFMRLKASCVPLLGSSLLTPASIPTVSNHLQNILTILREVTGTDGQFKTSLISYVFIPISTILQRNPSSSIPDHILERLLEILAILCELWWWEMDVRTWEQVLMLSSAVVGGLEGSGKGKERDDETKAAAVRCLWVLLHERSPQDDPDPAKKGNRAKEIFDRLRLHTQSDKFIPIIGQSIHSLLATALSPHKPLQKLSLDVVQVLTSRYILDAFAPSILPGVASTMCKVALGVGLSRGWANGDVVSFALEVLGRTIVLSIGDDVCARDGAVKRASDLESLSQLVTESAAESSADSSTAKFHVRRTPAWLTATATQLHMALISLQPLVNHQTPSAQISLATFSSLVLESTTLTLPQSQPLLLSYLLSLSACDFPDVESHARKCIQDVLAGAQQHALLHVLLQISKDSMSSLPRLLALRAEPKLVHAAKIVEAVCSLTSSPSAATAAIQGGIETLLGPNGGIEKWGWSLLSAVELTTTSVILTASSAGHLLLTSNAETIPATPFPEVTLRHASSRSTTQALQEMFQALGRAAGESCVYSIEWFFRVGRSGRGSQNVAALWITSRLLEGAARVSLSTHSDVVSAGTKRSKRLDRVSRGLSKLVAETWDESSAEPDTDQPGLKKEELEVTSVQHVVGLLPVRGSTNEHASLPSAEIKPASSQPMLHRMLMLQLLAITSGVLEARFVPTLLDTLFPILHSLTSDYPPLATTALATLQYVANVTSYASPANLLLSNFDYALDAVSRRLTRRWLDLDATSVLVILVRLVGRDVVQRAGDVVEECFDRLDEYHGYEVLVNGLMSVLAEVVDAIAADSTDSPDSKPPPESTTDGRADPMQDFLQWFAHRKDQSSNPDQSNGNADEDFGPVPQEAWGSKDKEEDQGKRAEDPIDEPPSTPTQLLVQQIISRSLYFLTHESRLVRARILSLLSSAATVLPPSLILPSIHHAWPFILNRLADPEPFVVSAAATLVENLALHFGDFMYSRIWDDIWPRFREILQRLQVADSDSALARRGLGAVGTESAYTHSHRLYRSLIRTMAAAAQGVQVKDSAVWDVIMAHRRFLHKEAHEELQSCARALYVVIGRKNEDAVWFALKGTEDTLGGWSFLHETKWDIRQNVQLILQSFLNTRD
ncbi:hypothetical protein EIP91_000562 [Steccherinum ochraceum]|uniref:TEL2-interacting protein 1 n=1 Tax=Steccherinum ochraceum TaxID=92696 RepID=A0A4R0RP58_9APHY|nr:hypothetical protein EIP91_000562 [Steccherinum ochraceum]